MTNSMAVLAAASRSISALADVMCTVSLGAVLTIALSLKALSAVKFDRCVKRQRVHAIRGIVQAVLLPRQSNESKNRLWGHFLLRCNFPTRIDFDCKHQLYC